MIYFTSDTHFGHKEILRFCDREFSDLEEHDSVIIDNINATVKRSDILYHLGDFSWKAAGHYRQRINCKVVHLIQGNHDPNKYRTHFSTFNHMLFLKKPQIHLCHYPLEDWWAQYHGGLHLHGHTHSRLRLMANRFDVGIDNAFAKFGMYRPMTFEEAAC